MFTMTLAMFTMTLWIILLIIFSSGGLLLLLLLTGVFFACKSRGCGTQRGWGLLFVLPLLVLLFFLGTARVQVKHRHESLTQRHADAMEHVKRERARVAEQARQVAPHVDHQIANMDIQMLMDKADAPRIVLAAEPAKEPQAPRPPQHDKSQSVQNPETTTAESAVVEEEIASESSIETTLESSSESEGEAALAAAPSGETDEVQPPAEQQQPVESVAKAEVVEANTASPERGSSDSQKRPGWVDDPPKRVGHIWRQVIETDEYATIDECYRASDAALQVATYDHLAKLVGLHNYADGRPPYPTIEVGDGTVHDSRIDHLVGMGIGIEYIRREIAKDEYLETTERSFGRMKKLYTLIEFSSPVDDELRARWESYRRQERFAVVGAGAGSILGLLGLVWGFLKIDTATKGYYTKRLFFLGLPAALMAGFGLLMVLMEGDVWDG